MVVKNPLLTKKDYETAAENGIGENTLRNRVYDYGWDPERAKTEPVKSKGEDWQAVRDIAVVPYSTFRVRRRKGYDPITAATKPPNKVWREPKYSKTDIAAAAANGIKEKTFKQRIRVHHMTIDEAKTRPLHQNRGKGLRKKNHSTEYNRYLHG